ncbi:acyl-CoA dehydratase activase [Clostridium lacusfryxellense]|uniref:acyl-CoA dehydratase activase n=1 Tax=Clostridium lacusfryxellense TaxID=205328 RepID=UPI001C0E6D66|nr:acyl-CoA dehydratase activase [Clostridium lacusfryxellense]MBU3112863.1 2-hydroxyglutaryl-CoA dehydratase [Clostridium lacusfryxellense]
MRVLGIDLGSREVKIVLMEDNKIIQKKKVSTMSFYRNYCNYDGKIVVDLDKLDINQVDKAVSTGYGKNNTDLSLFSPINEIKAHVYGGFYQTDLKDFILLDVGGQDVKVVKVEKGITTDLELNEKCAASCGRYLENMANVLEVSLDDMSRHHENPIELNSTCAVFSESELIGKIAEGVSIESLCASVNYSLYKRLQPLLCKFKGKKLVLTGGVANNYAIKYFLEKDYDEIVAIKEPQFNGAIGCCYYGSTFL